ncbi:hypothetical protein PC129_g13091 [Phytophthora cactorum]|uniref:Uncharacterized protein n=1 Tax=Phytophthora cactorum TaxID=29920 RepID=A0A8T1HYH0_9STRA|nr:hypothetical protein Pcac1_g8458 [Phytophthora cactorum]KAG2813124.1 hypothetical protein PC112_g14876 [Phytophthora cactorum]KAG2814939.1 hypothetical protein PC111_g13776 [Phytophthora cactorum]KAG2852404.1 hypothetical protein PC113_g15063 [Phytophthora cactorum]KAG2893267.1 hypothetical protein PC114_g16329 [Phytophthora cactorum]
MDDDVLSNDDTFTVAINWNFKELDDFVKRANGILPATEGGSASTTLDGNSATRHNGGVTYERDC